jgi:hypothetical protein
MARPVRHRITGGGAVVIQDVPIESAAPRKAMPVGTSMIQPERASNIGAVRAAST